MNLIIELLLNAAVVLLLAYLLPSITVKNYGTAFLVAVVVAFLNFLIGWIFRFAFNLVSLYLLQSLVSLIVTAIMIKIADQFFKGFKVKGWIPAFIIAICIAVANYLI
ncbi:MAG: phage holin family protein [Bacteroidetes bacterium]|nr:phage holin family protein [Bacteroidota bacterium]MBU1374099.1 phage holin family protein [Bacteroidota bacterium]MBU1484561.1 phage holin family protein [Bacteroidota bacterium]MBU1759222.1 phage holin family protein [Bacteroidota bacterium]MBU2046621.1 phage holin family protein [Bacteroidota bacterium]